MQGAKKKVQGVAGSTHTLRQSASGACSPMGNRMLCLAVDRISSMTIVPSAWRSILAVTGTPLVGHPLTETSLSPQHSTPDR